MQRVSLALSGDPEHWTEKGFVRHMVHVQGLRLKSACGRDSTALNRARYVRQLRREGVVLSPPDEETWLDWLDTHLEDERRLGSFDGHRKALLSLLSYLRVPRWESLEKRFPMSYAEWDLVPDDVAQALWTRRDLHPDSYLGEMIRACLYFAFQTGLRSPSELVMMDLDNVDWETGYVRVFESKKDRWRRIGPLLPHAVADLADFVRNVRGEVAVRGERALFPIMNGRRPSTSYLARLLREAGRRVWEPWHPYQTRYWFATKMLIQTDFNVYKVARALGDTVAVVEKHYLHRVTVDREDAGPHGVVLDAPTAPEVAVEA